MSFSSALSCDLLLRLQPERLGDLALARGLLGFGYEFHDLVAARHADMFFLFYHAPEIEIVERSVTPSRRPRRDRLL
jgi:hypothetical protein